MSYFTIRTSNTAVELWSGCRIQFDGMESSDWQKEAKVALKDALANLVSLPGTALSGYYDSTDLRPTDAENSLFTNFLESMPKGVRFLSFEQGPFSPPAPPNPVELVANHLHYYRYEATCRWTAWEADRPLARWSRVPRRLTGDGSARPTWFALREANYKGLVHLTGECRDAQDQFGVKIIIHATRTGPRNAITNSESTIDGIIAAFHNDSFSADLAAALHPRLPKVTAEELRLALDSPIGPLFDTPAITCSKSGFIQMSPADELCLIGELVICNDSTSQWPELSGELFTIRPKRAA